MTYLPLFFSHHLFALSKAHCKLHEESNTKPPRGGWVRRRGDQTFVDRSFRSGASTDHQNRRWCFCKFHTSRRGW